MNKVAFFFVISAVASDIFPKNDSLDVSPREDNFFDKIYDDLREVTNELFTSLNLNRDFMETGKIKTLQMIHDTLRNTAENNFKIFYDMKNISRRVFDNADKTAINLLFNLSQSIEETLKENHLLLSGNATEKPCLEQEDIIPKNFSLIFTNEKYTIPFPVKFNITINLPISDLTGSSFGSKNIATQTEVEKNASSNTDVRASVSVAEDNEFLNKKEMSKDALLFQNNNVSFTYLGFSVVTKSLPISDVTSNLISSNDNAKERDEKTSVQYLDKKILTLGNGNVIEKNKLIVKNYSFPERNDGWNEHIKLPRVRNKYIKNNVTRTQPFIDSGKEVTKYGRTVPLQISDVRNRFLLTYFTSTFKSKNCTTEKSFFKKESIKNFTSLVVRDGSNGSLQLPEMNKMIPISDLKVSLLTDNSGKIKSEEKVLVQFFNIGKNLHFTKNVKSDEEDKLKENEFLQNITSLKINDAFNASMKFPKVKKGFPMNENSSIVSDIRTERTKPNNKAVKNYAEMRKPELTGRVIKSDNSAKGSTFEKNKLDKYSDVRKSLPIGEKIEVGKSEIVVEKIPLIKVNDRAKGSRQIPAVRYIVPISDLTGNAHLSDNSAERSESERKIPTQFSDVRKSLPIDDIKTLDRFEKKEINDDFIAFKIIDKSNVFPRFPAKRKSFPISDLTGGGLMSDYSEETNGYEKEISLQYADVRKSLPINDGNKIDKNETDYSTMINIDDKSNVSLQFSKSQSFSGHDELYCLLRHRNNNTAVNRSEVGIRVKNFTSTETTNTSKLLKSFNITKNNRSKNKNVSTVVSNNNTDGTIFAKKHLFMKDFTSEEINRLKASIQGSNMRKVFEFNDTFLPENSTENLYDEKEIPFEPLVTTDDRWDDSLQLSSKTDQLPTNIVPVVLPRNWTQRTITAEHRFFFKRFTENDVKIPSQKQYFRRNYINYEPSSQNQTVENYTPSLNQSKYRGSRRTTASKKSVTRKINLKAWLPLNSSEILLNNTRRIYKGKQVNVKKFPFMASIHIHGSFMCGGSIINRELILTAASCLQLAYNNKNYRDKPSEISVRVGSEYTTDGGQFMKVVDVYFHPKYDCVNLRNNLAIARINQQVEFKKNKKKVRRIDFDRIEGKLPESGGITILGWGDKEKYSKYNGPLSMARLEVYGLEPCKEVYTEQYVNDKNFCAGSVSMGSGACNRDVGGPGIIGSRLVGVVSFGPPTCGTPDGPTVFTKVGFYSKWIDQVIDQKTMPWKLPTSMLEASINQTISGENNYVPKKVLRLPENETKAVLFVRKLFKDLVMSGHIQNYADLLYPDIEIEPRAEDEDKDKEIWTTKMSILNPPFPQFTNRSAFLQPADRTVTHTTAFYEDVTTADVTSKLGDLIVTHKIGPDIMAELSKVRDVIEPILFSQKNKSTRTTVKINKKKKPAVARPKTFEELLAYSDSIEFSDNYENNGNEGEFSHEGLSIEVATTIRAVKKSQPKFNSLSESPEEKSKEKQRYHKHRNQKKGKQKHSFRALASVEAGFSIEDERKVTIVEAVLHGGKMGSNQVEGTIVSAVDRNIRERNPDNYVEKPQEEEEDEEPSRRNFLHYVNL